MVRIYLESTFFPPLTLLLQRHLQRLASLLTTNPKKFILWPASILFIISYPLIYSLLSIGLPEAAILSQSKSANLEPHVLVKQLYISPPPFSNALSIEVLQSLIPFLEKFQSQQNSSSLPYLHSIINTHHLRSEDGVPVFDFQTESYTRSSQLYSQVYLPRLTHHKLTSASGLLISYVFNDPTDELYWNNALTALLSTPSSINTFSYVYSPAQSRLPLQTLPSPIPFCSVPLLGLFVTLLASVLYVMISWELVSSVRSKIGLTFAYFSQYVLSMSTALTIVSFIFPSFSANSLRNFSIIPLFIFATGFDNVIRMLNAVGGTPHEYPPSARLFMGVKAAIVKAVTVLAVYLVLLLISCIAFVKISQQVVHICLFTMLSLLINFCMHMSYFLAIVFADMRRLELTGDMIDGELYTNSQPLLPFDNFVIRILKKQYSYLRHLHFNSKVSASTAIFIISLGVLSVWSKLAQPEEMHNYSSGTMPFFISKLQLISNYEYVKVFEPLVLQGEFNSDTRQVLFHVGTYIRGLFHAFKRIFSLHIFLEFLASFAFLLSLTGVVLKFVLPSFTDFFEPLPSKEVMEFSSKELTGYHTLDVLKVITQGSMIATVSLDHNIFVWNAATCGSKVGKPYSIPNPPDFWPISRVVLNSALNLIAIFSTRIAAVKCYNYQTGKVLYHLQDKNIFHELPVEVFFSGPELILITRKATLMSIPESGVINSFKVDFSSKSLTLTHAKRLVTPRIPERVVCFSAESDITIGTHIGNMWRFRKLQIQDSPVQISLRGVNDLSKYKPQPIPAPHAMVARLSMRPGKMAGSYARPVMEKPRPKILENPIVAVVTVPSINMVLLATSVQACLFDAQTGIIVKNFQLGHFKSHTLRVFHSLPTHCRFCGCASIDSLSIVYSDAENEGMVICHTLTIDNRAKNSICIRVERDPRETRCLGFEATTERQHWIHRVEGWDTTDMNMIMGVRKKEPKVLFSQQSKSSSISWLKSKSPGLLRNRKSGQPSETPEHSNEDEDDDDDGSKFPLINAIWEGFAMSATGQVSYYDIPDNTSTNRNAIAAANTLLLGTKGLSKRNNPNRQLVKGSGTIGLELDMAAQARLLIRSIGPVTKFGTKSIAVAFGNIIKVLYFGKEESLPTEMDISSLSSSVIHTPKQSNSRLKRHPSASMMNYNSSISMQYNTR